MGHIFTEIKLVGHGTKPIPNTFIRSEQETDKLAIIFPGLGYTCHMPMLYYTTDLLSRMGFDVLLVEYKYLGVWDSLSETEKKERISADANAAYKAAMAQREYKKLLLVGKSIGTVAISSVLEKQKPPAHTKLLWFTPLLTEKHVYEKIKESGHKSLSIIGSRDPDYSVEKVKSLLGSKSNTVMVVDDANHSLEVEGKDTAENISLLYPIIKRIREFLAS